MFVCQTNKTLFVMKAIDLFFSFLSRRRVVFPYLFNYCSESDNRSLSYFFENVKPELYISSAFFWTRSPEGSFYWGDLDDVWLRELSRWREQTGKAGDHRREKRR